MRFEPQARLRRPLAVLSLGLIVALGPAATSVADPVDPSQEALDSARSAVTAGVSAIADIEVQLAQQSVTRDTAYAAAAAAGEAYLQADQARQAAEAAATRAAELLAAANADTEASRRTLVAIALSAARSGSSMDGVAAFLSADGFDDVVERSTALSRMGAKADRAVQEFKASTLVANALSERADEAVAERERTANEAEAALATATTAQADADAAVAAATAQRESLIVQLAAARSTTAEIERARQDQIDADRAVRASAAAQAARTVVAVAASPAATPAASAPAAAQPATPAATAPAATAPGAPAPAPAPAAPAPAAPAPVVAPPVSVPSGSSRGSAAQGAAAVAWATGQLGLPYVWGATGPGSYDCSGFTSTAWRNAGLSIGRTSRQQYSASLKISYNDLRPGDLVFWGTNPGDPSTVYHVAMWAGNGQIVEAARPGVPTHVAPMRWASTMDFAGRP
ncbi:C40 family peptidase [Pengzhenrongella sicca]|uniref:C40 family peptidase n=1 Tax=Pengzhenrongella sicca TaxID=2819238 RepID=A0A8A4ZCS1_9MICO|nr:C40 family peptidase [Pengzhenrongella sicca]QTE29780.1 C40 family peptidase [Pengzhenrongella sicca]